jgi:hypothetical protein
MPAPALKPKKKRGRPATGRDLVTAIRLPEDLRVRVEAWAARQLDTPSRSEAVRRLVEHGLVAARVAKQTNKKSATKAAGLAGEMVDYLSDRSVSTDVRERRKRRLLKGPSEFREMRTDQPKPKAR